jgi:hypothetical protein
MDAWEVFEGLLERVWPQRERDVAAWRAVTTHGRGLWRGRGAVGSVRGARVCARARWRCGACVRCVAGVAVARRGCARTRAGPGFPGPQRGRAVRRAPASRARGTTRRRRTMAAAGCEGVRRVPAQKAAQGREGKGVLGYTTEGSSAFAGSNRVTGVAAWLTVGLAGEVRDTVAGRCTWAGAVQGARLRRRSRTGAGSVKGSDGMASCSSSRLRSSSSSSPPPLLLLWCGGGGREKQWGLGFTAAAGLLIGARA